MRILKDLDAGDRGPARARSSRTSSTPGSRSRICVRNLEARKPASLEVCALLTKPARRKANIRCRYVGFEIANRFAIGYGLDYARALPGLPYVAALDESKLPEPLE